VKVYVLIERGDWQEGIDDVILGVYREKQIPEDFIAKLKHEAKESSIAKGEKYMDGSGFWKYRVAQVESTYKIFEQELL
jgi:hypothetical protein